MADTSESNPVSFERPLGTERSERPSRLGQSAAWVGIAAGVVFVVAVIFFSGVLLGRSSDDFGWRRDGWPDRAGGHYGTCPMMGTGGMMPPGEMGPMGPRARP
ncbi:hypothetical protein [Mycobacterium ahvazicum]|uniref:hypothetical protein n=1 Tax=Mycobacterium ahvazicum TaxID=1964395 RepID=UPI000BB69FF2|nr:hypothetical protein [Mycobacterium ahvazicum]